jgi:hypothetical protein
VQRGKERGSKQAVNQGRAEKSFPEKPRGLFWIVRFTVTWPGELLPAGAEEGEQGLASPLGCMAGKPLGCPARMHGDCCAPPAPSH